MRSAIHRPLRGGAVDPRRQSGILNTPMTSEEYARFVAEYVPLGERTPLALYAPAGTLALQLGNAVRESDKTDEVLEISATLLRYLVLPGMILGVNAPSLNFFRIDRLWSASSGKNRHHVELRELQLVAVAYVNNACTLNGDPAGKPVKLRAMAEQVLAMLGHLEVVLGRHGLTLLDAAAHDAQRFIPRAEDAARISA